MEHLQKLPLNEIAEKYLVILRTNHGDTKLLSKHTKPTDVRSRSHFFPDGIHLQNNTCFLLNLLFVLYKLRLHHSIFMVVMTVFCLGDYL